MAETLFAAQHIMATMRALAGHLAVRIIFDAVADRLAVNVVGSALHLAIREIRSARSRHGAVHIHAAAFHLAIGIEQQQLAIRLAFQ
ncbi:hypothetical protein D3C81_2053220 [compost metagenome]